MLRSKKPIRHSSRNPNISAKQPRSTWPTSVDFRDFPAVTPHKPTVPQPPAVDYNKLNDDFKSALAGLSGKPLNLACALCSKWQRRHSDHSGDRISKYLAGTMPKLRRAKQAAERCRRRLEKLVPFPSPPAEGAVNPAALAVNCAINALAELEALDLGPTTKEFQQAQRAWNHLWNSSDAAMMWALYYLLTRYGGLSKKGEVYLRIRNFRSKVLGVRVAPDSIRTAIERFDSDPSRAAVEAGFRRFLD